MKKTILAIALLALTSSIAHSEEAEPALMDAPSDYVSSLLSQCKEYAVEDEIAEADMKTYLLNCINDELKEGDYKAIKVLPKDE
ncbi:hypothetical protein [Colwellia hornerae]|uniref:Uncharacterized protein n=1 Tax=Colwellia hornerae TaxID=89402 RepID=A0A5C6Q4Y1_9GAMM|nr:hypothetical protein [Colwellia hornerae]TWX48094.1 hypothetical protein ESZ28_17280 [Colwellia hornerae]TWX54913.1 hypothetical protein ESZ26_17250 [Colwellia hornerae]TWX63771.1 hypothetical protein ESZ27_16045 [Colwellia hornerae]